MKELNTQTIIDYTPVPTGWLIKGHLDGTVYGVEYYLRKCGRVGVIGAQRKGKQSSFTLVVLRAKGI